MCNTISNVNILRISSCLEYYTKIEKRKIYTVKLAFEGKDFVKSFLFFSQLIFEEWGVEIYFSKAANLKSHSGKKKKKKTCAKNKNYCNTFILYDFMQFTRNHAA